MSSKAILKKNKLNAVRDYVSYLNNSFDLDIHKIYIYGSQIRGGTHKDSDIDVAIISKDFKDDFDALQYLWTKRRMKDVRNRIEPVGFSLKSFDPKSNPLAAIIKEEGIEVKI